MERISLRLRSLHVETSSLSSSIASEVIIECCVSRRRFLRCRRSCELRVQQPAQSASVSMQLDRFPPCTFLYFMRVDLNTVHEAKGLKARRINHLERTQNVSLMMTLMFLGRVFTMGFLPIRCKHCQRHNERIQALTDRSSDFAQPPTDRSSDFTPASH